MKHPILEKGGQVHLEGGQGLLSVQFFIKL
jgi:hypothetical protein